jgi:hypothetical protein
LPPTTRRTTATAATVTARIRHGVRRQSHTIPAPASGTARGPIRAICSSTNPSRPSSSRTLALLLRLNSRVGHPLMPCHTRLGSHKTNATATPAASHRLWRWRRPAGVATNPASRPNPSSAMVHFVWRPRPNTAPTASHQRGSARSARSRTTSRMASVHHSWSNSTVWKSPPAARKRDDVAVASADNAIARPPPPNSRATTAARTTIVAWTAPAINRNGHRWLPATAVIALARSGTTGGWST